MVFTSVHRHYGNLVRIRNVGLRYTRIYRASTAGVNRPPVTYTGTPPTGRALDPPPWVRLYFKYLYALASRQWTMPLENGGLRRVVQRGGSVFFR
ncbi:hypothetical protein ALC62_11810 [Cyphomyrmex costatus]|uniref:Uncharacterized protein n=1 Tax=Cyphomyrmex costatus TaxID=456900 RepID=A0A195CBD8_9HYME|nr:hypothetical protein ALC62_11810 [Cyphomyrmex costatus]